MIELTTTIVLVLYGYDASYNEIIDFLINTDYITLYNQTLYDYKNW